MQNLEAQLASELAVLLKDVSVGAEFAIHPSASVCYSLELFIPRVLSDRFSEWEKESLDGIFVAKARKTSPNAVEFWGTCILISDQTVTPLYVELVLTPSAETIDSFRVRLGEQGGGKLGISGPECNSVDAKQLLVSVSSRLNDIVWTYSIESDAN